MGKGSSSSPPSAYQPTAPRSSWGNSTSFAPMSGYTRAGQGVVGADMAGMQRQIEAERQRREQMRMQQMQAQQQANAEPMYFYSADGMSRTRNPYYQDPNPRPPPRNNAEFRQRLLESRNSGWSGYGNREYRNTGPGSPGWKIRRGKSPWEDGRDK